MINVGGGKVIGKTIEFVWKPQCTEHPRCTHDIRHTHYGIPPLYSWYPLTVLNTPGVLMISRGVLNDIPQCTEHPPVYCTDIMQGNNMR